MNEGSGDPLARNKPPWIGSWLRNPLPSSVLQRLMAGVFRAGWLQRPHGSLRSARKRPLQGPLCDADRLGLRAGLTARVDGYRGSRRGAHLHPVLKAAEDVSDIPVVGTGLAGRDGATLHIPRIHLLAAIASDVRAHRSTGDRATDGSDIPAGATADLVAENATDDRADLDDRR